MGPRICMERIDNDENDAKDSFKFRIVENVGRNEAKLWPNLKYPDENKVQSLVNVRINIYKSDCLRSLFFIIITAALIYAVLIKKIEPIFS